MFYQGKHAKPDPKRNPRWLNICLLILGIILVVVITGYPFVEPYLVGTEQASISSMDLPEGINISGSDRISRMKIAYVTDIHWDSFFPKDFCKTIVRRVNSMNADLVLLGGDYGSSTEEAIRFFEKMPKFHARYGIYGVLGDRDMTNPELVPSLKSAMRSAGVTPLENESASVRIGDGYVSIAGIRWGDPTPEEMQQLSRNFFQNDYVIYLSHTPLTLPTALSATCSDGKIGWFDLGLFGHTHGGQMPLFTSRLGLEKVESRYKSGWKQENRIDLLISNGVGTVGARIRLFRMPEIHMITVERK